MLKVAYNSALFLASILAYPFFYFRKNEKSKLFHRYGNWGIRAENIIWIHAASVGEVSALFPLISLLRKKFAHNKILITTLTINGLDKAKEISDYAFLYPFDSEYWLRRAFRGISFKMLIICETEIWPNMINLAHARKVPIYAVNARISEYSFPRYKKLKFFLRGYLKKYTKIMVINEVSKARFIELGAPAEKVSLCGYSKYDVSRREDAAHEQSIKQKIFTTDLPLSVLILS